MANDLCESICTAIASLSTEENEENTSKVENELKPLLEQAMKEGYFITEDCISPLLVASDRGNVACLHFLANYDAKIVGSPLGSCPPFGNTPVHHAAMSGCSAAWSIFQQILSKTNQTNNCYLTMGSAANHHGDTPLQIAVPARHLEFLQSWYERVEDQNAAQTILQCTNQSGDTCASLACCHGQVDILEFLLTICKVLITQQEVTTCQKAVDRMDQALKMVSDPKALESFKGRQQRVHECFDRLKTAIMQQAEEAAQALLLEDETDTNASTKINTTKATKKSKKKKKTKGNPNLNNTQNQVEASPIDTKGSNMEPLHVKRLNDGRVAVSVQGQTNDEASLAPPSSNTNTPSLPPPSAQAMLRQRFRNSPDTDIDAVMDALCLDVAMLLYTPHGMALNLSPSQLDAVEQTLLKQIGAVQEARALQHNRMLAVEQEENASTKEKEKDED